MKAASAERGIQEPAGHADLSMTQSHMLTCISAPPRWIVPFDCWTGPTPWQRLQRARNLLK
jgi:hypothetical protein